MPRSRARSLLGAVTPFEWTALVAAALLVGRYASLTDDAWIYFRYADNAVLRGQGLVYNEGEWVEGYSSPAWMLLLAALRWCGLGWWPMLLGIGWAALLAFWGLLVRVDRHLSPAGARLHVPTAWLLFTYAVGACFVTGLETPLVQVAGAAFALYLLEPSSRPAALLVGASPLVRAELVLPLAIALSWVWLSTRRFPSLATAAAVVSVGGWELFRVVCYADLLPNTYYLKSFVDAERGLAYVRDTVLAYRLWVVGPLLAASAALLLRRKRPVGASGARLAMLACAAAVAAWVVRIGGDYLHYRYLAFSYVLALCAGAGLLERLLEARLHGRPAVAFALSAMVGLGAFLCVPAQLSAHPLLGGERQKANRLGILEPGLTESDRLLLERAAAPVAVERASVRIAGTCALAYAFPDARIVHRFGLTEPMLARTDVPPDRPGHRYGLFALADDLLALTRRYGPIAPGRARAAVEAGEAPAWIADNLAAIELVERKVSNRHGLLENLRLALTPAPRIRVPPAPRTTRLQRREETGR